LLVKIKKRDEVGVYGKWMDGIEIRLEIKRRVVVGWIETKPEWVCEKCKGRIIQQVWCV
jgi:hypothetical protein